MKISLDDCPHLVRQTGSVVGHSINTEFRLLEEIYKIIFDTLSNIKILIQLITIVAVFDIIWVFESKKRIEA